jgi:hypothetical protein
MSERQFVFKPEELLIVSCECPHCRNVLTYSVLTDRKYGVPDGCPTCNEVIPELAKVLALYREFYAAAVSSKLPLRIRTNPAVE